LAPSAVPGEGIVYALPKSDLEVVQPATLKVPTAGPLQDVFDSCRRACNATGNKVTGDACDFSSQPKVVFGPPELRTVSAPDLPASTG